MKSDQVVVTGRGTVNAIAKNVSEFAAALKAGTCGIGPVTLFDTAGYRTHTGAQVKDFDPLLHIPRTVSLKRMSRADCMAMAATLEALADAGLTPVSTELAAVTGVVIGGGAGGMLECEPIFARYLESGADRMPGSPFAAFSCASSADHIATHLKLMGPKTTFMTACSSGATAIGYARDLIRQGTAEVVVCGGTEPLCRITYSAFNALQAVDPDYCKPFDRDRQGLTLGEGAGILILESLDHARKRGATVYGEVLGCGISCDASHMTAPDMNAVGAVSAMTAALADAGISADNVDYINAHGTATPANDLMETRGIKSVFGTRARQIPVSSTKSMIGHTLGAAGAIEAVVCMLAIEHQFVPPTIHHETPGEACDLDYVSDGTREAQVNVVLSNSFAFGGNNTVLAFGRFSENGGAR
ncbi:MAG: beta-ketoacyl-[acyl-carrier-protein] synthase family protein [Desulfosarcina sp.]|nr:beta-ketoacyl-[acyl-carrier-protein] synthase family protein [Desulfosarcina sp.]MBC2744561.1 beta-ketoacyl-[acyl-carrier-protein] synthase family protein [Desulfosarcina sp.]MBC2767471.1 beta-ketoacyl-[acyl-carrier-protein] synthase family protein [Desulfosarcina sp.]